MYIYTSAHLWGSAPRGARLSGRASAERSGVGVVVVVVVVAVVAVVVVEV